MRFNRPTVLYCLTMEWYKNQHSYFIHKCFGVCHNNHSIPKGGKDHEVFI